MMDYKFHPWAAREYLEAATEFRSSGEFRGQ